VGNVSQPIDLRSDTVTKPTREMLEAMSRADLGDDFFRDDPTVLAFEEEVAELLGLEAAMLVISGTMGNIVSCMALSSRGESFIVESRAHIQINESGWPSTLAGLTPRPITGTDGAISPAALDETIQDSRSRLGVPSRLLCLENTHNAAGGRVMVPSQIATLAGIAHSNGMRVHLDGARIFNASVALGRPVRDFVRDVDTATFCLSKGLSCPLGAVVAGSADVIKEARRWRQVVGGGMRQAGIIAAAGQVALQSMVDRLQQDHENATLLASRLEAAGMDIDVQAVETNILFVNLPVRGFDPLLFHARLLDKGVVINPPKGGRVRLVVHRHVSKSDAVAAADLFVQAFHTACGGDGSPEQRHVEHDVAVY
jgi:threonine aldolase